MSLATALRDRDFELLAASKSGMADEAMGGGVPCRSSGHETRHPLRVRVDSQITLDAGDVPPRLMKRLRDALSFSNPIYWQRLRMRRYVGGELPMICLLEEQHDLLRLPRGGIHLLRQTAAHEGLRVMCDDQRVVPAEPLSPMPDVPLRDYQEAAVDKLAKVTQGVIVMPCGGGKTRCGIGAIERLRTPTLVLVHTLDLAEQWRDGIRELLGVEAGFVGGGETLVAPITVAVVQTLVRWGDERLTDFLVRFGFLITDEAHHTPATTFRSVVGRSPARYRLGLTATPEREDGLGPLLDLYFGPALAVVTHEALIAAGLLEVPRIVTVETDFEFPYRNASDRAPMLVALAHDDARNQRIIDTVVRDAREGHVCLVLSGLVEHCEMLEQAISAYGIRAGVMTRRVTRKQRKALLHAAREGDLSVLIATSLADEGLDLPRLSRGVLACPVRARGRSSQRLGRLMRPHPAAPDKVLYDFVDSRVPILRRYHFERRRLYAELLGATASELGFGKKGIAA